MQSKFGRKYIVSTLFILAIAILPALVFGDTFDVRDGIFWQRLNASQRRMWATGWMDGLMAGANPESGAKAASSEPSIDGKLYRITNGEIAQGMDQLYDADYRNLQIPMAYAAQFVADYMFSAMSKAEIEAKLERLRAMSHY